jgi:DNA-binding CsgD family transcriptional regulator/tetratricopeptide (TPR) repeat protein
LSSRRFVGRVGELAELELAVREATLGRPTLVLLGGDSGLGKTRLVTELAERVATNEPAPLVLRGDGVEQADGELPYAPLIGALRPLVRGGHPALDALGAPTRARLATLLPGLEDAGAPPLAQRDDGGEQLRLFEALLALLDEISQLEPVVLILEDMHWADRSTRSFVTFLARSMRTERLALVLTYRTDELHRRHPLRPLLSELERLGRARRIELEPFDRAELAEALADILGSAPADDLLERLLGRGEGNPLFTEELLAAGLDGRGAPPRSLRDAFMARIERLSPDAQHVVRAATSAFRALDEPALEAVSGLQRAALQTALREAVAEQVLLSDPDGAFGFRHALLREAVADDLLPGERGELHLALARHLEERPPPADRAEALQRSAEIASHYTMAGDQPAALRASVRAGREAQRAHAPGEALGLYRRALELWSRVPDAEQIAGLDHVTLLCLTAAEASILDERSRAEMLLERALDELDPDTEPVRYAETLFEHGRALWSLNRGDEAVAAGERALAMMPADAARPAIPIRAWLARLQTLRGKYREARTDAEPALAAAVAAGDRGAESELLNTLGMIRVGLGEIEAGLASLQRAIVLAREDDDFDRLGSAHSNLADMYAFAGRGRDAVIVVQEGLAAVPHGQTNTRGWLRMTLARFAFETGDWEQTQTQIDETFQRPAGIIAIFRRLVIAQLAAGIGDDAEAMTHLDAIAGDVACSIEPQWIGPYGALRAELQTRAGELEAAQATIAQALDRMEVCTDDIARIAHVSLAGLHVEAQRAQRGRDLGDAAMRRDAVSRARIHLDRIEAAAQDGGPIEAAALLEGRAELARSRGRATAKLWEAAAGRWEALELPYRRAIAQWREAESRAESGDRDAAAAAAAPALRTAHALGSRWLEGEIRALAGRARLALGADGPVAADTGADAGGPAAPADPFGLTDRERQVLALVAQGATNRQVGETLFMAEKTASVHVSRILAKLGVRSRTEAAAVAHRHHLT